MGSVNQGVMRGRAVIAASIPMRPRDVIPVDLKGHISTAKLLSSPFYTQVYGDRKYLAMLDSINTCKNKVIGWTDLALYGYDVVMEAAPGRTVPCI